MHHLNFFYEQNNLNFHSTLLPLTNGDVIAIRALAEDDADGSGYGFRLKKLKLHYPISMTLTESTQIPQDAIFTPISNMGTFSAINNEVGSQVYNFMFEAGGTDNNSFSITGGNVLNFNGYSGGLVSPTSFQIKVKVTDSNNTY